jgi:hypothetical protein
VEWDYPFIKGMQNDGVDNVISDICLFLRCEIFHVEDTFFGNNGMLAEFPQLCTYERFSIQTFDVICLNHARQHLWY